ncbi:MAG TPA: aspartate carbamoyltransferase [Armatimonadetes bacterium]|nr:aspartate carbamoyltransferase [Armatimonadota bacterium]
MSLQGRDLITINDLTAEELEYILAVAERMRTELRTSSHLLRGRLLVTAFYEPSTRTRLSFEAAIHRLGGSVIGFASPEFTSVAKGETLADTVRILSSYGDVIVIRHYLEGSAKVAADYAPVPVINAGDGGHQHPTQTLTDLFTIHRERGQIDGLHIGLCGDLKYGRTVHSLLRALRYYNVTITCIAPEPLQLPPQYVAEGQCVQYTEDLEGVIGDLDVLYMTRIQKERFEREEDYFALKGVYVINSPLLEGTKPDLLIMHPLPRVDEISPTVDADRRAVYFGQAAYGVPVRMALLALILGRVPSDNLPPSPSSPKEWRAEPRCPNPRCANHVELYTRPQMEVLSREPLRLRCAYCEMEIGEET